MTKQNNVVKAYIEGINLAPRKVSIVASLVAGRLVDDALLILAHTPRRAALPVKKAIESARANAINNHGYVAKSLIIKTISVTTGTRYKRYKPASRGRALPFQKKSSNILVELIGNLKPKKEVIADKTTVKKVQPAKDSKKESVLKTKVINTQSTSRRKK